MNRRLGTRSDQARAGHRSPMRVAMVMERFPQEPFLASQVAALVERSIDVHVLCQIHDRDSDVWSLLDGVDMTGRIHEWSERSRPLALAAACGRSLVQATVRSRLRLLSALRAERGASAAGSVTGRVLFDARLLAINPDVVHFQFGDLARNRLHIVEAVDVAFTSSFRGYDLAYAGLEYPHFYDRLWPALDGAHTLGQDLLQRARQRGAPEGLDWTIIAPAVDLDWFDAPNRRSEQTRQDEPVRILSVGRLHWKKGLLDGLAAMAEVVAAGHQLRYRIVGAGPAEEQLRWTIDDLGLSQSVELIGGIDAAGVRDQLEWADIFVHPSLTEGFGNAVLEAQAMSLPVVCTDAEGLAENVVHGATGLVVPRRQPLLLAEALISLIADRQLRFDMGERGRARVEEGFGLEAQTDAFIDFFERAIERSGSGPK